jgi:hypothetical protein
LGNYVSSLGMLAMLLTVKTTTTMTNKKRKRNINHHPYKNIDCITVKKYITIVVIVLIPMI